MQCFRVRTGFDLQGVALDGEMPVDKFHRDFLILMFHMHCSASESN